MLSQVIVSLFKYPCDHEESEGEAGVIRGIETCSLKLKQLVYEGGLKCPVVRIKIVDLGNTMGGFLILIYQPPFDFLNKYYV